MMMTYIYDIHIYIYICYGKGNKIGNYAYFPAVMYDL